MLTQLKQSQVIGNGSFGVVYQAKLCPNNQSVAIKKVLQDKRFKVGFHVPLLLTSALYKFFFYEHSVSISGFLDL